MAYTAEQIVIKGIPVEHLNGLTLNCVPGEHGSLKLNGSISSEKGENALYEFTEQDSITVSVKEGRTLFSGILTSVSITEEGGNINIEAEAKSRSILLDQKKKSRSFQDVAMTYDQLFKAILAEYPKSELKLSLTDKPLGEIAIQYEETDWQFLKRMLSMLHGVLVCRTVSDNLSLYGGIPDIPWGKWEYQSTGYRKEMGEYAYWSSEGAAVSDNDFLILEVETDHVPEIFEQVTVEGKTFVIRRLFYELERGRSGAAWSFKRRKEFYKDPDTPCTLLVWH